MELSNQNYIIEQLRGMGISEEEIQRRVLVAKMSNSGDYNPLSDTYTSDEENALEMALNVSEMPSNVPPLLPYQDIAKDEAKPVSSEPVEAAADRGTKVTMFAVANRYVRLLNSLSGAASPLPLGSPSVCFS